ncbi:lysophospholipid acyltransferase family protein [Suttonella sp. R2A3]|uniref:GNAT family N-acyltransferase n=1 Tax=Suttonella sp. R2A3 TaxID=2908648 RepID=UPI001F3816DF|nr:GNAT family N-acyltransferase [Suttonella sp. R2A3]UJF25112.1 lysophospholipid acyltransferase family protein [Suttonella sp. R2A3]
MIDIASSYKAHARGIMHLPGVRHAAIAFLRYLLHEREINDFLQQHGHLPLKAFIEEAFAYLEIDYSLELGVDAAIPAHGRCVVVANHPLGGIDGLILLHAMLSVRDDVKIVANEQLCAITPLAPYVIPVDVWRHDFARKQIRAIEAALHDEEMVIIFPAGEVSRMQQGEVADRQWSKAFYHIARSSDAPILPIYVDGRNSQWFYQVSRVAPFVSTLMLAREMWRPPKSAVKLHLAKALSIKMLQGLPLDLSQVVTLIRQHVYQLSGPSSGIFNTPKPIADALDRRVIRHALRSTKLLGHVGEYQRILYYQPQHNAVLLQEVGRLRELAFREVGEGSGQARDLDKYDSYYHHLLIWHNQDQALMGAYRVLPTEKIYRTQQLDKLYTHQFFEFCGDTAWLNEAMELGRGFICPEYWNTRALDTTWQGIGAYYAQHPSIRYLFGGVSISPQYPREAVDWLVAYYRLYYASDRQWVKARNPYVITAKRRRMIEETFTGMGRKEAEKTLKQRLKHMNLVIPPLFKHYSALCEEGGVVFADFAVDPDFGCSVDGFVVVDMQQMKAKKRQRYIDPHCGDQQQKGEAQPSSDALVAMTLDE